MNDWEPEPSKIWASPSKCEVGGCHEEADISVPFGGDFERQKATLYCDRCAREELTVWDIMNAEQLDRKKMIVMSCGHTRTIDEDAFLSPHERAGGNEFYTCRKCEGHPTRAVLSIFTVE